MLWVQGGRLYDNEEDMNMINPKEEDTISRAARALRESDEDWLDEHAAELTAQELNELYRDAAGGEDAAMLLEHADKAALRELLQLAAKEERWELVSLAADILK